MFIFLTMSGATRFSGRSMTLIDPTYAKDNMPLIASVAEHAPSTWINYFWHLNTIILFVPLGLYFTLVKKMTLGKLFIAMYLVCSVYFSSVMIRLLLVLAPAVCVLAGIGVGELVRKVRKSFKEQFSPRDPPLMTQKAVLPWEIGALVLVGVLVIVGQYIFHSTHISAENMSNPQIIVEAGKINGRQQVIDDYREAYYWLKHNTA